jgi:hypothetical protein
MEVFFNLLWLVIVLASFARWRRVVRIRRGLRGRVQAALPFLALVCALAILFPTISVTDNLHPSLFVAEDGSSPRRAMAAVAGAGHGLLSHPGYATPPALLPILTSPLSFTLTVESVRFANFFSPPATLARILPSRAPPSL